MRVRSLWAALAAAIMFLSISPLYAEEQTGAAASSTSHWQVYAWIGQQVQSGILTMKTSGDKVVATFNHITIHGTLVDYGKQINATYTGPRGDGWITLNFHNEDNGFGGTWGLKGKPADGKFVGTRVQPGAAPPASP